MSLSDVDLATLHRTRLEEKINYNLSHNSMPYTDFDIYSSSSTSLSSSSSSFASSASFPLAETNCDKIFPKDKHFLDLYSGFITNRQRSGTWP